MILVGNNMTSLNWRPPGSDDVVSHRQDTLHADVLYHIEPKIINILQHNDIFFYNFVLI